MAAMTASPCHAQPMPQAHAAQQATSPATHRPLRVRATLGFPWNEVRLAWQHNAHTTLLGEVSSALGNRLQPSAGARLDLFARPDGGQPRHKRLWLELLAGYQYQYGSLPQRGPSAIARVGGQYGQRWFVTSHVQARCTMLIDALRIDTEAGLQERLRWRPLWTPGFALAMGRHHGSWTWQFGLNWRFVDVGVISLSLPGLQAAVTWRGG